MARVDVYCRTGTVIVSRVIIAPNIYDNNSVVQDELSENQVINYAIRSSDDHINNSKIVEGNDKTGMTVCRRSMTRINSIVAPISFLCTIT